MARQDSQTEYIVAQEAYDRACAALPPQGTEGQVAQSIPVVARQYRQNASQTINAGKWVMWAITEESFAFTWANGVWNPPANLVILKK